MKKIKLIFSSLIVLAFLVAVQTTAQPKVGMQNNYAKSQKTAITFKAYIVDQELKIEFNDEPNRDFSVELFNLTGKKTDTWNVQRFDETKVYTLALEQVLPNGIYIVKLIVNHQEVVKKIQF